jgi:hypothetical protein
MTITTMAGICMRVTGIMRITATTILTMTTTTTITNHQYGALKIDRYFEAPFVRA